MYKILNDDTAPSLRNSLDHHLRNSATDLTLPKPKREFLKRSFKYSGECFGTNSQMKQKKRKPYIHLINVSKRNWVMPCLVFPSLTVVRIFPTIVFSWAVIRSWQRAFVASYYIVNSAGYSLSGNGINHNSKKKNCF